MKKKISLKIIILAVIVILIGATAAFCLIPRPLMPDGEVDLQSVSVKYRDEDVTDNIDLSAFLAVLAEGEVTTTLSGVYAFPHDDYPIQIALNVDHESVFINLGEEGFMYKGSTSRSLKWDVVDSGRLYGKLLELIEK